MFFRTICISGENIFECISLPWAQALVTKYQKRISDPLLDGIDIYIEVPRVDYEKLSGERVGESSVSIRARVQTARNIQTKRYSSNQNSNTELSHIVCNADMRVGRSGNSAGCPRTLKA
jgi:magnesium chelatase family protein